MGEVIREEKKLTEEQAPQKAEVDQASNEEKSTKLEAKEAEGGDDDDEDIIVLTVFMHCEGCARKVRRCLKGFQGVESVETDCRRHRVIVKGEKADPLKVLGRLQRKTHRQVQLISPIPEPPPPAPINPQPLIQNLKAHDNKPQPQPQPQPHIITVVLKVHMHCETCAQEIKRRIHRMKGVESVDPDLKSSQVTVKGEMDPAALVEYVHRRTGKHATIVKELEPEIIINPRRENNHNNYCSEDHQGAKEEMVKLEDEKKEDIEGGEGGGGSEKNVDELESKVEEKAQPQEEVVQKNEYDHCHTQSYIMGMYPYPVVAIADDDDDDPILIGQIECPSPQRVVVDAYPLPPVLPHAYPPQMFSDDNPNACSLM